MFYKRTPQNYHFYCKLHKFIYFYFLRCNRTILFWTIKIIRGKSFRKVDHIDCKIVAFEVKKRACSIP
jgi:hypothetical protein